MPIYAGSHLVSLGDIPSAFTGYERVFGVGENSNPFFRDVAQAGGTLTDTERDALNTLESELKSNNIWNDLDFLFPFVGGVSGSCALSMVNTSTYSGSFDSNWVFDSSGITGTNAEMTTNIPNTLNGTTGAYGLGMYIGNNIQDDVALEGSDVFLRPRTLANNYQGSFGSTMFTATGITDSIGHYTMTNTGIAISQTSLFKNGSGVGGGTETRAGDGSNYSLGRGGSKTSYNFCIIYGGSSITSSNVGQMNTIVNNFITSLSR